MSVSIFRSFVIKAAATLFATFLLAPSADAQSTTYVGADTTTVYITATGSKYHRRQCQHLHDSRIEKKLGAVKGTYGPCGTCKPIGTDGVSSSSPSAKPATSYATGSGATEAPKSTSGQSVQCSGRTQKGARCKRMITNSSGRCYQH